MYVYPHSNLGSYPTNSNFSEIYPPPLKKETKTRNRQTNKQTKKQQKKQKQTISQQYYF